MPSQAVAQQNGSTPQIFVAQGSQLAVSGPPVEQIGCAHDPPPSEPPSVPPSIPPSVPPPPPPAASTCPLGVPSPVGPSYPACAEHRYAVLHDPLLPVTTS